ncbi:MAG: phosphatidate cytidylyltransferase [Porphyromonas sp.]|nr:phosphatidate cytidylyltransferase [Porphyromonas sp.]
MSELAKRTIFGLLYVGLMLAAVILPQPYVFLAVFSFLAFMGMWEYQALVDVNTKYPLRRIFDALIAVLMLCAIHELRLEVVPTILPIYIGYVFVSSMYGERSAQPSELAKRLMGHLYITLPLSIAAFCHAGVSIFGSLLEGGVSTTQGILLVALIGIWCNDTGAFIFGSQFGKRRLFPSLSPKKSWEGFWGGMLLSMLSTYLLGLYAFPQVNLFGGKPVVILAVGAIISIFATWGDLFESMLKRQAGVKDSGAVIPGHGGVLDRIDSILFVLPAVYYFLSVVL